MDFLQIFLSVGIFVLLEIKEIIGPGFPVGSISPPMAPFPLFSLDAGQYFPQGSLPQFHGIPNPWVPRTAFLTPKFMMSHVYPGYDQYKKPWKHTGYQNHSKMYGRKKKTVNQGEYKKSKQINGQRKPANVGKKGKTVSKKFNRMPGYSNTLIGAEQDLDRRQHDFINTLHGFLNFNRNRNNNNKNNRNNNFNGKNNGFRNDEFNNNDIGKYDMNNNNDWSYNNRHNSHDYGLNIRSSDNRNDINNNFQNNFNHNNNNNGLNNKNGFNNNGLNKRNDFNNDNNNGFNNRNDFNNNRFNNRNVFNNNRNNNGFNNNGFNNRYNVNNNGFNSRNDFSNNGFNNHYDFNDNGFDNRNDFNNNGFNNRNNVNNNGFNNRNDFSNNGFNNHNDFNNNGFDNRNDFNNNGFNDRNNVNNNGFNNRNDFSNNGLFNRNDFNNNGFNNRNNFNSNGFSNRNDFNNNGLINRNDLNNNGFNNRNDFNSNRFETRNNLNNINGTDLKAVLNNQNNQNNDGFKNRNTFDDTNRNDFNNNGLNVKKNKNGSPVHLKGNHNANHNIVNDDSNYFGNNVADNGKTIKLGQNIIGNNGNNYESTASADMNKFNNRISTGDVMNDRIKTTFRKSVPINENVKRANVNMLRNHKINNREKYAPIGFENSAPINAHSISTPTSKPNARVNSNTAQNRRQPFENQSRRKGVENIGNNGHTFQSSMNSNRKSNFHTDVFNNDFNNRNDFRNDFNNNDMFNNNNFRNTGFNDQNRRFRNQIFENHRFENNNDNNNNNNNGFNSRNDMFNDNRNVYDNRNNMFNDRSNFQNYRNFFNNRNELPYRRSPKYTREHFRNKLGISPRYFNERIVHSSRGRNNINDNGNTFRDSTHFNDRAPSLSFFKNDRSGYHDRNNEAANSDKTDIKHDNIGIVSINEIEPKYDTTITLTSSGQDVASPLISAYESNPRIQSDIQHPSKSHQSVWNFVLNTTTRNDSQSVKTTLMSQSGIKKKTIPVDSPAFKPDKATFDVQSTSISTHDMNKVVKKSQGIHGKGIDGGSLTSKNVRFWSRSGVPNGKRVNAISN